MKIDPYNHERRYKNWKERILKKGIKEVSKENAKLIMDYVFDMENEFDECWVLKDVSLDIIILNIKFILVNYS
jgi:hypothetical protein